MGNTTNELQGSGPISSANNTMNTIALKENYSSNVSYPSSPSFRRTMLTNVRQSWVFNKPPPIPEAESVYVQPTAILEKNMTTAKSRLSVFIQKDIGNQHGRIATNSKTEGIDISSHTINEVPDIENLIDNELLSSQLLTTSSLSSRPISNVSSSNQDSSEYDVLSDSSQSLSSSFASTSIITNNRDSMSDTTSTLSNSLSISNDHSKFNRLFNNNVPNHRYSMPSSREFTSPNSLRQYTIAPPRRASMPILSNDTDPDIQPLSSSDMPIIPITSVDLVYDDDDEQDDDLKELEITNNICASFSSNTPNESSSVQHTTLRPSRLSSPANAQLAQRASRASMKMSLSTLMQKRFNIAFEILTTERHYVDCLQLVQRV
jgi:hypothetical protein